MLPIPTGAGSIDRQRQATENELAAIIEHVAQAPFASYRSHVPTPVRKGLEKLGMSLAPGKVPTVEWHLLKRVYLDQQWPVGTTEDDFLRDLHQAIVHPQVQVWTYRYYTHPYIGFLAPSHVQQVPQPERHIFVVDQAANVEIAYGPTIWQLVKNLLDWGTPLSAEQGSVRLTVPAQTLPMLAELFAK